ncbi:hypothetical protein ERJ75_000330500 [Trypanosoma vivax]|uniref:Uncharacterized protein n=1 Tax=Trypanosoma vivax (strain Y486) TaxID=1055687 RepID=G0UAH7_TRYVY|nr:hypothetical protein ERJ75_000330500 [Trypanosoma vivax]CCC52810.1 conserved hypothetical protein [Trypanosoma vivax Y486]
MLFRESVSDSQPVLDVDDASSSEESFASCYSQATQAFENKMLMLVDDDPMDDVDFCDDEQPGSLGFTSDLTTTTTHYERNESPKGVDDSVSCDMVSCFNCDGDTGWSSFIRALDDAQKVETQFHEYPTAEYFKLNPPPSLSTSEHNGEGGTASGHQGIKMFIGGLRFEVVQAGRQMISWIFKITCGVQIPVASILVHRKAKGGRSGSPTGCASIFVANEEDVESLLAMNQRIYCAAKGVHVTASAEQMAKLFELKTIGDIADSRKRGPSHPVVIERAYGAAGQPSRGNATSTTTPLTTSAHPPQSSPDGDTTQASHQSEETLSQLCSSAPSSVQSSLPHSLGASAETDACIPQGRRPILRPGKEPKYIPFPGDDMAMEMLKAVPKELQQPAEVFVGGLPSEATNIFVAWFFSLIDVPVHPQNIDTGSDSHFSENNKCALVSMEDADVPRATNWTKRVLCDAGGVCLTKSHHTLVSLLANRGNSSNPAQALFIKRKDPGRRTQRTTAAGSATAPTAPSASAPAPIAAGTSIGVPPPPFPVAWEPPQATTWQPSTVARRAPPPYMQNVIIGNQTYQVPVGASIQLQLVPVITAPGVTPTPVQPVFQAVSAVSLQPPHQSQ